MNDFWDRAVDLGQKMEEIYDLIGLEEVPVDLVDHSIAISELITYMDDKDPAVIDRLLGIYRFLAPEINTLADQEKDSNSKTKPLSLFSMKNRGNVSLYRTNRSSKDSYASIQTYGRVSKPVQPLVIEEEEIKEKFFTTIFLDEWTHKIQKLSKQEGVFENEYMAVFWAMNIELMGKIIIQIPLVFFNTFKQEVTSAHITYEGKEINAQSTLLQGRAEDKMVELWRKIGDTFSDFKKDEIKLTLVPLNTIHAHPSGINRFSSTDLRKTDPLGIVYLYENDGSKAGEFYTSASIMQHIKKNHVCIRVHTEGRKVTLTGNKKDQCRYAKIIGESEKLDKDIVAKLQKLIEEIDWEPEYFIHESYIEPNLSLGLFAEIFNKTRKVYDVSDGLPFQSQEEEDEFYDQKYKDLFSDPFGYTSDY